MEKVLQELFWTHLFWGPVAFKLYKNKSGCDTDNLDPI